MFIRQFLEQTPPGGPASQAASLSHSTAAISHGHDDIPPSTSGKWSWGHYVVVHPAGNTDITDACARYRALLADQSTFSSVTLEELLDAGALPTPTVAALRDRYLPG
jgi:hypothetical protein